MDLVELGGFLKSRRDRLNPRDLGLQHGPRRRVAGLRRDEVATLAVPAVPRRGLSSFSGFLQPGRQILSAAARRAQRGAAHPCQRNKDTRGDPVGEGDPVSSQPDRHDGWDPDTGDTGGEGVIDPGDLVDDPRADPEALCLCTLLWSPASVVREITVLLRSDDFNNPRYADLYDLIRTAAGRGSRMIRPASPRPSRERGRPPGPAAAPLP